MDRRAWFDNWAGWQVPRTKKPAFKRWDKRPVPQRWVPCKNLASELKNLSLWGGRSGELDAFLSRRLTLVLFVSFPNTMDLTYNFGQTKIVRVTSFETYSLKSGSSHEPRRKTRCCRWFGAFEHAQFEPGTPLCSNSLAAGHRDPHALFHYHFSD